MFLHFFADYYRKPFYIQDVSLYAKNDRCIEPSFLKPQELARLYGRESLLTEEEVMNLRVKALNLKIGDTGYHQVNDEGEVYNVLPADYTGIIHSVPQRHGGEIKMSHLVGELLRLELKGCSTHFVEKLIINVYGRDFERPDDTDRKPFSFAGRSLHMHHSGRNKRKKLQKNRNL